ncbi:PAS domain S-box protein [Sulfuricaulis sp.]|uniref:PAS domain-containing sensor histidine kinase n=1 Tax=Sulfuricaulis sp. TaxID=2003553 RepID=UPI00355A93CA
MEIVERRRSNDSSLKGEARFRAIFARASVGVALIDRGGYAIEGNPALRRMLGYTSDELRMMAFHEFVHPEDVDPCVTLFREMLDGRRDRYQIEKRFLRKSGEVMWGRLSVSLLREKEDGPAFGVAILEDITERYLAEQSQRESEARFRLLADSAPVLIWMSGTDKRCTYFNLSWLEFTGRTLEQELGDGWAEGVHPEDLQRCVDTYVRAFDAREPFTMEYRLRRHDGEYRWIMDSGAPLFENDHHFSGYIGSCIDITERKRAEEEHLLLAAVVDSSNDAIFSLMVDRTIRTWNPAAEKLFGYSAAEIVGRDISILAPPDRRDKALAVFEKVREGLSVNQLETICRHKDGTLIEASLNVAPIRNEQGQVTGASAAVRDITGRKRAEEALQQSEFKFRALFESNVVPLAFWRADGCILDANDAYLRLTGFSRAELEAGQVRWAELTAPEHSHLDRRAIEEFATGKQTVALYEKEYVLRDGRHIPVMISISLLPGHRDRGVSMLIDLTEQKRSQERLEESRAQIKDERAFLRQVIDIDPNFIFAKDREGRFTLVNRAVADAYGTSVENLVGKTDADFNPNVEEVEAFRRTDLEVMDTLQERFMPEEHITDSKGKVRWLQTVKRPIIEKDGTVNQVLGSATDITERRQAELEMARQRTELSHITRVSMMGELTSSLAHELNQPLTAILSNVQTVIRLLDGPVPDMMEIREILGDIVTDDQRAGEIIRGLRSLLKKSELKFEALDLNSVILEVIGLIRSDALIKHVAVALRLTPDIPNVRGDRIQLQQLMLNLAINALDAMRDIPASERRLDIATTQIDARAVQIAVQDSGVGIPPDRLEKVFDPFFTDKPQGMGMGLAICRSIARMHDGRIWAANNTGRGATFRFIFPIDGDSIS